jgi:phospholipid transport system transporter-binding protein
VSDKGRLAVACGETASNGTFSAVGDRWQFDGALTFDDATAVLEHAAALPLPASGIVDMAGLVHADSAALAVLLELKKRAAAEGHKLSFAAFPPMLESLAHVYGIEDLFA